MTKEEWFELFDENKDNIKSLMYSYHPWYGQNSNDLPITAPNAEIARQTVVKSLKKNLKQPNLESRNLPYLVGVFNEIWFSIPESYSAHSLPGFGALCDLCSDFPDDENFN